MSELKLNNLIVKSIIKDATSVKINDGYIELDIEGGVPPYRVKWDIGKTTKDIYNLYPGTYKVQIVDSSNSFTLSESYVVESLEVVIPSLTPSITPTPTPTPSYNKNNLCLSNKNENYTFIYNGLDKNRYDTWINEDNSLTIFFNLKFMRWEINGWTEFKNGILVNETKNKLPLGDWKILGDIKTKYLWTTKEGSCSLLPLELSSYVNDETCFGKHNGSVKLIPKNGVGTYSYRIKGVKPYPEYTNNDVFTKLKPNTYTAEVNDTVRSTFNSFVIGEGSNNEIYTVYLNNILVQDNIGEKKLKFIVEVIPQLTQGLTLNFDLEFTHIKTYRDNGTYNSYYDMTYTYNNEVNSFEDIVLDNSNINNVCDGTDETVEIYKHSKNFNLIGGEKINGEYIIGASIESQQVDCECPMIGKYRVNGIVKNTILVENNGCDEVNVNNNFESEINLKNCVK